MENENITTEYGGESIYGWIARMFDDLNGAANLIKNDRVREDHEVLRAIRGKLIEMGDDVKQVGAEVYRRTLLMAAIENG